MCLLTGATLAPVLRRSFVPGIVVVLAHVFFVGDHLSLSSCGSVRRACGSTCFRTEKQERKHRSGVVKLRTQVRRSLVDVETNRHVSLPGTFRVYQGCAAIIRNNGTYTVDSSMFYSQVFVCPRASCYHESQPVNPSRPGPSRQRVLWMKPVSPQASAANAP